MSVSPQVTVVITCYNYGDYLKEAIKSVLEQSYDNIKLIVIDDGSTDNSGDVARSFGDRLEYIYQDNVGLIETRNRGIEAADGDFLVFLDADDTLEKEYVEILVAHALKNEVDIAYTDVKRFGDIEDISNFPEYSIEILKNKNFIHVSSLIRCSAIGDIRFDKNMQGMTHEDWDFFLSLCLAGATAKKCTDTFLRYRIHGPSRNNTRQNAEDRRRYIDMYSYVIEKHKQSSRKELEYLSGSVFSAWYIDIDDEVSLLRQEVDSLKGPGIKSSAKNFFTAIGRRIKLNKRKDRR